MSKATGHDLHVDTHLTNVALNYQPMGMIADMIAPVVRVGKQSDSYPIWDQGDILRVEDSKRSPGTEANKITRSVSSGTYYAENRALKTELTIEDRENMDAGYIRELREGRTRFVTNKLVLDWEKRLADKCTSGSNVYSYAACASAWTDYTTGNSDPLGDLWTAVDVVQDATGYRPNSMLMGGQAWRNFRRHADVKDMIYGTNNPERVATRDQVRSIFELDRFLVGETYYNSADEGQASTLASIWADHVLLYFAPMAPSLEEPSFMYTMRWTAPGLAQMVVERHPFDPKIKAEEIEVGVYQDEKITSSALAFLFTNVTSSS